MRRSLSWQIAVPFIVLLLFLLAGLTIYFSNYLRTTYLSNLEEDLKTHSTLLAREVAPIIGGG